jgi:hypothetical protein
VKMKKYKVTEDNGYREWTVGKYDLLSEARAVAREASGHARTIWKLGEVVETWTYGHPGY